MIHFPLWGHYTRCTTGTGPVASATQPRVQHNPHVGTKPVSSETRLCVHNIIPCCAAGTRPVVSATQPYVQHNPHAGTEPVLSETRFCMHHNPRTL